MTDFYLLAAQSTCSAKDLVGQSYHSADKEVSNRFLEANSFSKPTDRLMRGELYAVPSLVEGPRLEPGMVGKAVSRANFQTRNQRADPAPNEFNANFSWMKDVLTHDSTKSALITTEKALSVYEDRAAKIADLFEDYRKSYEATARLGADFHKQSGEFYNRLFIERDIYKQLGASRSAFIDNANRSGLKDQLGISHKALKNQVRLGKDLKELKKIEDVAGKARGISSHLKTGGKLVKIVSLGTTASEIYTEYDTYGGAAALDKAGEEGAGMAGSFVGGRVGAAAGGWLAGTAVVAFGVSTGGLGFVAITVGGVLTGTLAGSLGGEKLGKTAYSGTKEVLGQWRDDLYTVRDDFFDFFVERVIE
ncbi:hypothetical protein ACI5KX_14675 [Erythrobacter sp. GH1-10]|uniref:hypothetical protein n=1 Tax=Erythrobacter sp. GH1-10 TaxID=3349334 RepID=UPI003877B730